MPVGDPQPGGLAASPIGSAVVSAALLALLAAVLWGTGDFLGGALARRVPTLVVLAGSQLGALAALGVALPFAGGHPPGSYLWWGTASGVVGTVALAAFYRALAIGTMSVVAPIAATGLVVPVLAGLVSGERPSPAQLAGIVAAATGVVLASGPELGGESSRRSVGLAALAAAGFGGTLALTARGADVDVATTTLASFATGAVLAFGWLAATRTPLRLAPADLPVTGLIGVLNVSAVGLYGVSTRSGLVSVVAVLASLYPVVTVLLARRVYAERLARVQQAGVLTALGGVVLLAAG